MAQAGHWREIQSSPSNCNLAHTSHWMAEQQNFPYAHTSEETRLGRISLAKTVRPSLHHLDFIPLSSQYIQNARRPLFPVIRTSRHKVKEPPGSHRYFGFSQGRALPCLMSTSRGWYKQVWGVTPTYEPGARVQHDRPGSPNYLLSYAAGCSSDFWMGQGDKVGKWAFLLTHKLHQYGPNQNQHPLKHKNLLCKSASMKLFLTWKLLTDSG